MIALSSMRINFQPSMSIIGAGVGHGIGIRSYAEPLRRAIQEVVAPSIKQNFDVEGRPVKWAPLSEFTKQQRMAEGYPASPILDRRRGSVGLKHVSTRLARWDIDGQQGTAFFSNWGSTPYGQVLQEGKAFAPTIPARPFLLIQPEDARAMEELFADWAVSRLSLHLAGIGLPLGRARGLI